MNLHGDSLVRLYSYQGQTAWDRAEKLGYWTGSEHIWDDDENGWGPAYDWMRRQMSERVPNYSGDYPMWGWPKRPSTKPKPRPYTALMESIRLTVLVPRSRIVFSDYDAWHSVLNHNLNCRTEAEWDTHCELFPDHWSMRDADYAARYMASIEPSWQGCLDFVPTNNPVELGWAGSPKYFRMQACVDRFQWSEIVGVRSF